jgi:hypothetical protein
MSLMPDPPFPDLFEFITLSHDLLSGTKDADFL